MRLIVYLWKRFFVLSTARASLHWAQPSPSLAKWLKSLYTCWIGIPHVARGIMVGLTIALLTHVFQETEPVRKLEDAGLDWMIGMYRGVPRSSSTDLRPILFLDIDERSYRHWGEPLFTPRDKLLKLIRYAVEGGAAAVIVDVELSSTSGNNDQALQDYLSNFDAGLPHAPEILLVRGIRMPVLKEDGLVEQRRSFLDDSVKNNSHLHWAAPLYQLDEDAIVRRWRLWEATCVKYGTTGTEQVSALPSFQLLASVLLKEGNNGARNLQNALQGQLPASCKNTANEGKHTGKDSIRVGDVRFHAIGNSVETRILYSIPWRLKSGESYPKVDWQGDPNYPLFTIKPAVVVTETVEPKPADLQGQVVFIGSSFADSRDIYSTPIGAMPGVMINANAFLSFYQNGEAEESPWLKNGLKVLLIVVIAVVFAQLPGIVAKAVASFVTLLFILPASFWLFRSGVWIDFVLPLAAVEFHAMAVEFEEKLTQLQTQTQTQTQD